ncbi:hypothetical protein [Methyloraptor flagellatus]|uniref:Uncharacterized protein n=1 Tax=Methyloraptor flagellatus TaxID=3162530 RepID=A0AAU7XGW1_9HYPH
MLCGERERARAVAAELAQAAPEIGRVLLGDAGERVGRAFRKAAAELLIELKALAAEPGDAPLLVQVVAFGDGPEAIFEGLHALLASARMEHPRLVGQVIRIVDPLPADAVVAMLADEVSAGAEGLVRHHAGRREIPNWEECRSPPRRRFRGGMAASIW